MSRTHVTRPMVVTLAVAILASVALHGGLLLAAGDAATMREKVAGITKFGQNPTRQGHQTTVTEDEVNSFLTVDGFGQLPAGITEPSVSILGGGRASGRAVVDFGALRKQKNPTGLFDPLTYLSGHLQVTLIGALRTGGGTGVFEVESGSVARVPVPKSLLEELLKYLGTGLDASFALPAHIREIRLERGQAIIVQ